MRTWSIESVLHTLERITRPPRMGHDVDAAGEFLSEQSICGTQHFGSKARHQCACILAADHPNEGDCHLCGCGERWRDMWDDGAEQLAEREAAEEVSEPRPRLCRARKPNDAPNVATFCDEPIGHEGQHRHGRSEFWTNMLGDDPAQAYDPQEIDVRLVGFTSCGQDMESYAEGFNEGFAEAGRQQDPDWQPGDDTPNPTEPGLSDDELVGVRGLLQERYEDSIFRDPPADDLAARLARNVHAAPAGHGTAEAGPAEVSGQPPEPPSAGRPTSELLDLSARALKLARTIPDPTGTLTGEWVDRLIGEFSDRADTFRLIETQ